MADRRGRTQTQTGVDKKRERSQDRKHRDAATSDAALGEGFVRLTAGPEGTPVLVNGVVLHATHVTPEQVELEMTFMIDDVSERVARLARDAEAIAQSEAVSLDRVLETAAEATRLEQDIFDCSDALDEHMPDDSILFKRLNPLMMQIIVAFSNMSRHVRDDGREVLARFESAIADFFVGTDGAAARLGSAFTDARATTYMLDGNELRVYKRRLGRLTHGVLERARAEKRMLPDEMSGVDELCWEWERA